MGSNNETIKEIDNSLYGGFIVSNNILYQKRKVLFSFREESSIKELNGWNLLSDIDDNEYILNYNNFSVVSAKTILNIAPILLSFFDAPYGTNLQWLYDENMLVGFIDLNENQEIMFSELF